MKEKREGNQEKDGHTTSSFYAMGSGCSSDAIPSPHNDFKAPHLSPSLPLWARFSGGFANALRYSKHRYQLTDKPVSSSERELPAVLAHRRQISDQRATGCVDDVRLPHPLPPWLKEWDTHDAPPAILAALQNRKGVPNQRSLCVKRMPRVTSQTKSSKIVANRKHLG